MFSEDESELRDSVIQSLEKCGFLSKIKAELRAGVCLAIEEDGNLKDKIPLFSKKLDEFAATTEGKLMLSIIREFLEFFNLHCTLSVFDPEIAIDSPCLSRTEICSQLNLKSDIEGPVISELIKDKIVVHKRKSTEPKFGGNVTSNIEFASSTDPRNYILECKENPKSNTDFNLMNKKPSTIGLGFTQSFDSDVRENPVVCKPENEMKESNHQKSFIEPVRSRSNNVLGKNSNSTDVKQGSFKEPDSLSSDHDPFFDEPLPTEKTSLFSFSDTLRVKPQGKSILEPLQLAADKTKSGLSSLKDLPSFSTNTEWTFSRDTKQSFPSLESQKSISSSDASNEEKVDPDSKNSAVNKDSDVAESNESSEKPNSEESIEEDIEDEDTAGLDDFLNSLSLADDATTDHSVSQTSVVDGVDHLEPCKQVT